MGIYKQTAEQLESKIRWLADNPAYWYPGWGDTIALMRKAASLLRTIPDAITLEEYQAEARRTQNPNLNLTEMRQHALFGLASEVGEIHALFQKLYQGHTLSVDALQDELGDLMWFASELADAFVFTLEETARKNIAKLRKRYPDGFSAERSLHRDEIPFSELDGENE